MMRGFRRTRFTAAEFMAQMTDIKATPMPELDPFQMRPQALARIQSRGIGGQALHVEALRCPVREEVFADLTAVNRGAIPDDPYAAWSLSQPMLQKGDDIERVERPFLAAQIQLALRRDGADGREMITGPPFRQDRGMAHWGLGADHTGQGIDPRFIDEEDRLPPGLCPLLSASQVSCRQCAMAASSRWRARRAGVCGLQHMALSKRPTWTG
jgi:hypothetical protein